MSKSISRTRAYDNLQKFLTRKKLENPGAITNLLFEKFVDAKYPTLYQQIKIDDLKIKKIIPSKKWQNLADWRKDMLTKGVLVGMASCDDYKDEHANVNASMFKFGMVIKKYIEAALAEKESIFERLDQKADLLFVEDELNALENRMNERLELAATKDKLNDLNLEMLDLRSNIETWLLYFLPPDTKVRRKIIQDHKFDRDKCIEELKKEAQKEAEESKRSLLKIV